METVERRAENIEHKVLLRGVRWETYEGLLADHENSSAPRFTYDRGTLEIMSPSPEHEQFNRDFSSMLEQIFGELEIDVANFGSTTFRREDLERGFEPDTCFYVEENAQRMRGKKRLDLSADPPPDLVLEIDITNPSINKFPIYARLGVPKVWRYDGRRLEISLLEGERYKVASESATLPGFTGEELFKLIEDGKSMKRFEWIKKVREAAKKKAR